MECLLPMAEFTIPGVYSLHVNEHLLELLKRFHLDISSMHVLFVPNANEMGMEFRHSGGWQLDVSKY